MTERVRGAIFNILGDEVVGAAVLDLFAGSGSLGFEALSRGAARCIFVERQRDAVQVLRRNVETLRFTDHARVLVADAFRPPKGRIGAPFDLVFVDPPYRLAKRLDEGSEIAGLVRNVFTGRTLNRTALVVLRAPHRSGPLWLPERVEAADVRAYGADCVRFLRWSRQNECGMADAESGMSHRGTETQRPDGRMNHEGQQGQEERTGNQG